MSEERLNVVIGASIGGLVSGVEAAQASISGLGAAAAGAAAGHEQHTSALSAFGATLEEALAPINTFRSAIAGVGEILLATFAVEKFIGFFEEMGKFGEHAVNMGASLGISAEQFVQLSQAMEIVGGNSDKLVNGFRLLGNAVRAAEGNDLGRQADAFATIVKSTEGGTRSVQEFAELLRKDPFEAFKDFADKFREMEEKFQGAGGAGGAEGPFGVWLGRSFGEFAKFMKEGADGIQKLYDESGRLGAPNKQTIKDLDAMDDGFNKVTIAVHNLSAAIVDGVSKTLLDTLETIATITTAVTKLVNYINANGGILGPQLDKIFPKEGLLEKFFPSTPGTEEDWKNYPEGSKIKPTGLDPQFESRLDQLLAAANAAGYTVSKGSGFRSHEEQKALYDADVAAHGGHPSGMVAAPGHSKHEEGLADDLRGAGGSKITSGPTADYLRAHAGEYGLQFPMSYEPWHVEPISARAGSSGDPLLDIFAKQGTTGAGRTEINSAAVKKDLDEKLKGMENEQKALEANLKSWETYYKTVEVDADKAAAIHKQIGDSEVKAAQDRQALINAAPENVRKTYQDTTATAASRAADEGMKAEEKAAEEKTKLRLKELEEVKKTEDAKLDYKIQEAKLDVKLAAELAQEKARNETQYLQQRRQIISESGLATATQQRLFPGDMSDAADWKAKQGALKADQAVADQRSKIDVQNAQAALKSDQEAERSELQHAQSRARVEDQTADHLAAVQTKIVQDHEAAQITILANAIANAKDREIVENKLQNDLKLVVQKAAEEQAKIKDKAEEEQAKRATAINKEIAKTVSGGIVDLAWGKSTPGAAISSTAQDLEKRALDTVLTKALDASGIGSMLDKAFQSTIGSLFSKGVDTAVKGVAEAPIQASANALAMTPVITAQTTALITGITVPIVAAVTGTGAATAGTSALGAAGSAAGAGGSIFSGLKWLFTLEQGGIVPSAAGGWQVPSVGSGSILAQLHSNEMVLPSGISSFIQNAAASSSGKGGGVNLNYSPTIHAHEAPNLKQTLSRHGGDMLNWMQSQFRSGALRVPA